MSPFDASVVDLLDLRVIFEARIFSDRPGVFDMAPALLLTSSGTVWRMRSVALVLAGCALLLGACGDDDDRRYPAV